MNKGYECPSCKSNNILTERRLNGNSVCQECGFTDKSFKFQPLKVESVNFKVKFLVMGVYEDNSVVVG